MSISSGSAYLISAFDKISNEFGAKFDPVDLPATIDNQGRDLILNMCKLSLPEILACKTWVRVHRDAIAAKPATAIAASLNMTQADRNSKSTTPSTPKVPSLPGKSSLLYRTINGSTPMVANITNKESKSDKKSSPNIEVDDQFVPLTIILNKNIAMKKGGTIIYYSALSSVVATNKKPAVGLSQSRFSEMRSLGHIHQCSFNRSGTNFLNFSNRVLFVFDHHFL